MRGKYIAVIRGRGDFQMGHVPKKSTVGEPDIKRIAAHAKHTPSQKLGISRFTLGRIFCAPQQTPRRRCKHHIHIRA